MDKIKSVIDSDRNSTTREIATELQPLLVHDI